MRHTQRGRVCAALAATAPAKLDTPLDKLPGCAARLVLRCTQCAELPARPHAWLAFAFRPRPVFLHSSSLTPLLQSYSTPPVLLHSSRLTPLLPNKLEFDMACCALLVAHAIRGTCWVARHACRSNTPAMCHTGGDAPRRGARRDPTCGCRGCRSWRAAASRRSASRSTSKDAARGADVTWRRAELCQESLQRLAWRTARLRKKTLGSLQSVFAGRPTELTSCAMTAPRTLCLDRAPHPVPWSRPSLCARTAPPTLCHDCAPHSVPGPRPTLCAMVAPLTLCQDSAPHTMP
eukprot:356539-Chlamydomonas_euryale.AAC.1